MQFASKGAHDAGGLVVGILPGSRNNPYSEYVAIPIFTNANIGREYYVALSSDVIVVCSKLSHGTFIEALYALKSKVPLVVLNDSPEDQKNLLKRGADLVTIVNTPEEVIATCENLLKQFS